METCIYCGEEIEFRWVNGARCPIHVNGGWCTGRSGDESGYARSRFETVKSYLDPNARCPVCGASVFFYRSPHNGCVFFDDVGWPWPKHPCTDKYRGEDGEIWRPIRSSYLVNFKSREGRSLDVYLSDQIVENSDEVVIRLKNVERGPRILIVLGRTDLTKLGIEVADVREAPSLVLRRERGPAGETELSFMCARLQSVVILPAKEQGNS